MDPKLLFWCAAFLNFCALVALAARGVSQIRRGEVRAHRRSMRTGAALVGLFLVSYLAKVALLGHEDRSAWTALDTGFLYVHETCIALMLVGGAWALYRGWRFQPHLGSELELPETPLPGRTAHRRAGWLAVVASALALVTALGVLAGMFARS